MMSYCSRSEKSGMKSLSRPRAICHGITAPASVPPGQLQRLISGSVSAAGLSGLQENHVLEQQAFWILRTMHGQAERDLLAIAGCAGVIHWHVGMTAMEG